jgi:hypothetical protein
MKAVIGVASLILALRISPAEAIDLTCSGVMHYYSPKNIEVTVPPGAAIVDLQKRTLTTPIGHFQITSVLDGSISFDDPAEMQLVRHPGSDIRSNDHILAKSKR